MATQRRVRVLGVGGDFRVVAAAPLAAGDVILEIEGDVRDRPDRYSIQTGDARHVAVPSSAGADPVTIGERYPWRFLNHSCAPNARVRGRTLVAIGSIRADEEITFDYNSTEYEMASPFVCRCGRCGGREIGGFRRLGPEEQARLLPYLSEHLRRRLG